MPANFWITRFVIAGESSASPAATVRTAAISCSGESSLSTKPLAPALSASKTYSSRSNVVRIRIRVAGSVARMRRVACEPVELGHADVHQDDPRMEAAGLVDRLEPVARLGDDLHVLLAAEQHAEAGADHRLVVGDEDPDRHRASSAIGSRVLRTNPPSGAVPADISPP